MTNSYNLPSDIGLKGLIKLLTRVPLRYYICLCFVYGKNSAFTCLILNLALYLVSQKHSASPI